MQKTNEPALKRELGAKSLALNAMNLCIGSGIFVLPAIVAASLGPASFIAYLLCGLLIVLIMLCFAEVGSRITTTGGAYSYVERAFGPLAGFLINTLFWFGFCCLADAAVINAMTDMLAIWFPVFSIMYVRVIFFVLVYVMLTWINIRGVKQGSGFAILMTVLKLSPLAILVIIGLFNINPSNLAVKTWPSIQNIGEASLVLFFAFMGTESALNMCGEIKEPKKNIPKGILLGVTGVLITYLLLQFVSTGVMGSELSKFKDAPLAALAATLIGPVGKTLILITGIVSMFGLLSGDVLATPRLMFAASRDKLLPGFLSKVHPKYATPYWSIIAYSIAIVILASSGGFKQLAVLATSSVLLIYLAVVLATIRLRYVKEISEKDGFKIPGGLLVPILGIIVIGWFLFHITMDEVKAFAIFFAILAIVYFIQKEIRKRAGLAGIKK